VTALNSKGSFTVKSFSSTQLGALEGYDVASKSVWKSKVPQKFVSDVYNLQVQEIRKEHTRTR